jgi:cytochrome c peroxidase
MARMSNPGLSRLPTLASCLLVSTVLACSGGGEEGHHGEGHGSGLEAKMGRAPLAPPPAPALDVEAVRKKALKQFGVLPEKFPSADNPITDEKVSLGRMLYYEGRLSKSGDISCNSCHMLDAWGVDNNATSPGHDGTLGDRNSPTVYNAAGHLAQFWDGRAPTVEEQAKGPILNPIEMGMANEDEVLAVLRGIPGYVEAFEAAFPDAEDPISYDNLAKAIGAFERQLVTPAPIDAWLEGDNAALSEEAVAGLALFMDAECTNCHTGYGFGGSMYQKLGTEKPWPGLKDEGRYAVTEQEQDRFVFKVPGLRNVDKTAPYLHDGSIETLPEMVDKMVEHQVKRGPLSEVERKQLLAFLGSLTGELPSDYIAKPELPPGEGEGGVEGGVVGADVDGDGAVEVEASPKPKKDDEAEDKPKPKPKKDEAEGEDKPKPKPKPKKDEAEGDGE